MELTVQPLRKAAGGGDLLAIAFGAVVGIWTVYYVGLMPLLGAPIEVLAVGFGVCMLGSGVWLGRSTERGVVGGVALGVMIASINLIFIGMLAAKEKSPHATFSDLDWVGGSYLVTIVLTVLGVVIGKKVGRREGRIEIDWTGRLAWIVVAATGLLLVAGGLVTGFEAGLAVPDWPNSFGANMFWYPLERMTGPVYYEHAHRLTGALVGLATLALAVHIWMVDDRKWMKWYVVLVFIAVVVQGYMGGSRVFTAHTGDGVGVAQAEHETTTSAVLRVVHGVFAQVFLGMLIVVAVACSRLWRRTKERMGYESASTDRGLSVALVVALFFQLLMGALVRHLRHEPMLHMVFAAVIVLLVLGVGMRAWGIYGDREPVLKRLGVMLLVAVGLQVFLGVGSLIVVGMNPGMAPNEPTKVDVLITGMHHAVGALLLALATMVMLYNHRLLEQDDAAEEVVGSTSGAG